MSGLVFIPFPSEQGAEEFLEHDLVAIAGKRRPVPPDRKMTVDKVQTHPDGFGGMMMPTSFDRTQEPKLRDALAVPTDNQKTSAERTPSPS